MKKITLFIFTSLLTSLLSISLYSQEPIFEPTMNITVYLSVNSPANETVENAIDGVINTKYLDFEEQDGTGFTVDLGDTSEIAQSIDITTANDFELRDPTMVEISGSLDGTSFTPITTISIPCITERFFTRSFDFTNTIAYSFYRINFIQECDDIEGIIQIAEVQLFDAPQLSIDDFKINQGVDIIPNPSNGIFNINSQQNILITNVSIYDLTGKNVLNIKNNSEINASNLSKGMYLVKISTATGSVLKKLIIN
ncbi:T9SS type A sorting domain-containing protein [Psychroserpens sp. Hel_I_66]|uniref:T9SS type A sorting domain-containing protein n=1 Tax=Psychroserpens sp. Hel_I_66 TaxID=1250004 RepID=UPI000645CB97|nr:T9SS type A sorting domain-containing protein [Psychroserpens sp. Hel_I_66]